MINGLALRLRQIVPIRPSARKLSPASGQATLMYPRWPGLRI